MSYPSYSETKASGVEWSEDVPKEWQCMMLKRITRFAYGESLSDASREDGTVPVYGSNGIVGTHVTANTKAPSLIIGRKGSYGKVSYSSTPAFAIDTAFFVDETQTKQNIRWLYYLFSSMNLDSVSQDTGVPGLSREDAYTQYVPLPTTLEQQQIAAFLDRKTAELDAVLRLKERQLQLLAEKRQALISQAVTRGLDPTVSLKASGVEWLGNVPEHWTAMPIKFLSTKIGSGKTPRGGAEGYVSSGIIFLRSQNVYDNGLRLDDVAFINEDIDEEMSDSRVYSGDLLLNITGASIGRTCIVPLDFPRANVNQHVCIIRPIPGVVTNFLAYALKNNLTKQQILSFENGSSREGLNFEQVGSLILTLPRASISEQEAIVAYLDAETARMDGIAQAIQAQIEKVREYRQALISAAVTGKIDVRERAGQPA